MADNDAPPDHFIPFERAAKLPTLNAGKLRTLIKNDKVKYYRRGRSVRGDTGYMVSEADLWKIIKQAVKREGRLPPNLLADALAASKALVSHEELAKQCKVPAAVIEQAAHGEDIGFTAGRVVNEIGKVILKAAGYKRARRCVKAESRDPRDFRRIAVKESQEYIDHLIDRQIEHQRMREYVDNMLGQEAAQQLRRIRDKLLSLDKTPTKPDDEFLCRAWMLGGDSQQQLAKQARTKVRTVRRRLKTVLGSFRPEQDIGCAVLRGLLDKLERGKPPIKALKHIPRLDAKGKELTNRVLKLLFNRRRRPQQKS